MIPLLHWLTVLACGLWPPAAGPQAISAADISPHHLHFHKIPGFDFRQDVTDPPNQPCATPSLVETAAEQWAAHRQAQLRARQDAEPEGVPLLGQMAFAEFDGEFLGELGTAQTAVKEFMTLLAGDAVLGGLEMERQECERGICNHEGSIAGLLSIVSERPWWRVVFLGNFSVSLTEKYPPQRNTAWYVFQHIWGFNTSNPMTEVTPLADLNVVMRHPEFMAEFADFLGVEGRWLLGESWLGLEKPLYFRECGPQDS